MADLVAHGAIDYAVLIVGGNDIPPYLPSIFAGNTAPFVTTVVANIETALNTVAAADDVRLVVGNIPDVGRTPAADRGPGSATMLVSSLRDLDVAEATLPRPVDKGGRG